jgi:hypothetical protein
LLLETKILLKRRKDPQKEIVGAKKKERPPAGVTPASTRISIRIRKLGPSQRDRPTVVNPEGSDELSIIEIRRSKAKESVAVFCVQVFAAAN